MSGKFAKEKSAESKDGMQTIQKEIQKVMILLLACSLVLVGVITCILNYRSTISELKSSMQVTAKVAAEQINYRLQKTMSLVEMMGTIPKLSSDTTTVAEKKELVESYLNHYGWNSIGITDEKGIGITEEGTDISERDYFKKAINGETAISDPMISQVTGAQVIVIGAPIWKDGKQNSQTVGIIYISISASDFSDIVKSINISAHGSAYMLNSAGDTIAHENTDLVTSASNTIKEAETDSSLNSIAKLEKKMIQEESGFGSYRYNGVSKYMAFAPVGLNGWSLAVVAPVTDFIGSTIMGIAVTVILLILAVVIGIYIARKTGTEIGGAVGLCSERLKLLAEGDLTTAVPDIQTKNETKILADSTTEIVSKQQTIIGDIHYVLSEMAEGNFGVKSKIGQDAYIGAYSDLFKSISKLKHKLAETLQGIVDAAAQVDAGSTQLAEGAAELAQGATDQAAAVEEMSATVSDVTEQVEHTAKATDEAHDNAKLVGQTAMESQNKMTELTEAMRRIEETSNEIKNIIGEIEDIASQTNLLSLNAAIEAARAGEAGKGFAVVADQIGRLAEQSAQSAVNTKKMIESSITEVEKGSKIATETEEALVKVMEGLDTIVMTVADVKGASNRQSEAMMRIDKVVEQITGVVQTNSASAEESSATSEELSAQAQTLNGLVSQFTLE